ncbi:hypothetical protein [Methylotuvimicrobium buryatense]|uniref:Uncharacterized protein n=1 Tax=Methylotuvimicrobium buryatense TaxID=95641 RepID=A0A4P9UIU9_METBY|nr:hypothetical protein [Methylotuvimicrobium buryatense]QCW80968.1 hypothetical protein EQU24_00880 [Methylotuvimicrobium buryatense]
MSGKNSLAQRKSAHPSAGSQEMDFYAFKINILTRCKNTKKYVKQRLFHSNAMRPKGAYFAQDERIYFSPAKQD